MKPTAEEADKHLKIPNRKRYWAFKPKAARDKQKISQRQLAKLTGLTPSSISLYERGISQPNATTIAKMATALRVSPGQLFECREHAKKPKNTGPPECDEPGCESQRTLPQEWPIGPGEAWLCGDHRTGGIVHDKLTEEREQVAAMHGRSTNYLGTKKTKP
jgi:transcriptional regulator with XRE-family HTH domain